VANRFNNWSSQSLFSIVRYFLSNRNRNPDDKNGWQISIGVVQIFEKLDNHQAWAKNGLESKRPRQRQTQPRNIGHQYQRNQHRYKEWQQRTNHFLYRSPGHPDPNK